MKAITVTQAMLDELRATDVYRERSSYADNASESAWWEDDDRVSNAIASVAEYPNAAQDAVEALNSDAYGAENAALLLHGKPEAVQALVRKYFIRTSAAKICDRIESDYWVEVESNREAAREAACEGDR